MRLIAKQQHDAAAQRDLEPVEGDDDDEHDVDHADDAVRQQLADDQLPARAAA